MATITALYRQTRKGWEAVEFMEARIVDNYGVWIRRRRPDSVETLRQRFFDSAEEAASVLDTAKRNLIRMGFAPTMPDDPALADPAVQGLFANPQFDAARQVLRDWLVEQKHPHAPFLDPEETERLHTRWFAAWMTHYRCAISQGFLEELDIGVSTEVPTDLVFRLTELQRHIGARFLYSLNVLDQGITEINAVIETLRRSGCPSLRRLGLRTLTQDPLALEGLATWAPQLEELMFAGEAEAPSVPTGLRSLHFAGGPLTEAWLRALRPCALTHLALSAETTGPWSELLQSPICRELQTLSVRGRGPLRTWLPERCPFESSLVEADLRGWQGPQEEVVTLVDRFPALRRLRIRRHDRALAAPFRARGVRVDSHGQTYDVRRQLEVGWRIPSPQLRVLRRFHGNPPAISELRTQSSDANYYEPIQE
ncbi:MAG: hypothetical protein AAGA48_27790 [Myxococcota bacterium]